MAFPRLYRVPLRIGVWPQHAGPFRNINPITLDIPAYLLMIKAQIPLLQQKPHRPGQSHPYPVASNSQHRNGVMSAVVVDVVAGGSTLVLAMWGWVAFLRPRLGRGIGFGIGIAGWLRRLDTMWKSVLEDLGDRARLIWLRKKMLEYPMALWEFDISPRFTAVANVCHYLNH